MSVIFSEIYNNHTAPSFFRSNIAKNIRLRQARKVAIYDRGQYINILSKKQSDDTCTLFTEKLPITNWGRIDWEKIDKKININHVEEILYALQQLLNNHFSQNIYILWSEASLPIIKTNLMSALSVIDDIIYVGPDTWFLSLENGYVIEFFHDGEVIVGLIPTSEERNTVLLRTLSNITEELNKDKIATQLYFLEKEIDRLLIDISSCETVKLAYPNFDLLQKIQEKLSELILKNRVKILGNLRKFVENCDLLHSEKLRTCLFNKIKTTKNPYIIKEKTLFEILIETLEGHVTIINHKELKLIPSFEHILSTIATKKIDWEIFSKKINMDYTPEKIISVLENLLGEPLLDKLAYVKWDRLKTPIIKTHFDDIINHFDDIACLALEKFIIFNPFIGYVIEIRPSDNIVIGIVGI